MRWCLAAAALLAVASPALGYQRATGDGGRCLWWKARVVPYAVSGAGGHPGAPGCSSGGDALDAVRFGLESWARATRPGAAGPCTDLRFLDRGAAPAGGEGAGLVVWRERPCRSPLVPDDDPCHAEGRCGESYDCWDHGPYYVAVTAVRYRSRTGEIVSAEVELNAWTGEPGGEGFYFTCLSLGAGVAQPCSAPGQAACVYADLQTVVTHEAGHLLGLAHVPDRTSVMYHSVAVGEVRRDLTADDVEGVCGAYPAGGPTATCAPGGCASGPSGGGALGLVALAALASRSGGGARRLGTGVGSGGRRRPRQRVTRARDPAYHHPVRRLLPLLLLLVPGPGRAAVALPATVEGMTRDSEAVIHGRVEKRESRLTPDGRHVYTLVTLRTDRVLRGQAPDRVVVRIPGGEVGEIGEHVDAAPLFEEGEEVVVFLAPGRGGPQRVQGLALGKFRVEGAEVRPHLRAVAVAPGPAPAGERRVEPMPLAELERRVRSQP